MIRLLCKKIPRSIYSILLPEKKEQDLRGILPEIAKWSSDSFFPPQDSHIFVWKSGVWKENAEMKTHSVHGAPARASFSGSRIS